MNAEVWIVHSMREVIVTDIPGPLVGNGVLGDVVFVGSYPIPQYGWGEAGVIGAEQAKALGYSLRHSSYGND